MAEEQQSQPSPDSDASTDGAQQTPTIAPPAQKKKIDVSELRGRRLGRILTKLDTVTREQVHEALQMQSQRRVPIGQLLIELGYCTEEDINVSLAAQAGMESLDLEELEIPEDVIHILPAETALAYQVMPLQYDPMTNTLTVALKSASNFGALDDLHHLRRIGRRQRLGHARNSKWRPVGRFNPGGCQSLRRQYLAGLLSRKRTGKR